MLVISDNSPLNILVRIGQVHVLPALFKQIVVPIQIAQEMGHPDAPAIVRHFIKTPPAWLSIEEPQRVLELPGLDVGERAAISLALDTGAELLLVDEQAARKVALSHGLHIIGAVGVIERAADRGLIDDLASVHEANPPHGFSREPRPPSAIIGRARQSQTWNAVARGF